MAETEEEKKEREAKEAQATKEAQAAKEAEDARLTAEAEAARKRGTAHDPHHASADVTRDFFDKEWSPFKKANPTLFVVPQVTDAATPAPTKPHYETCAFGLACPFPNETH